MKKLKVQHLILGAAAVLISACGMKVGDSTATSATPVEKAFVNDVQGPSLDGTWKSGCEINSWDSGYVIFNITIKGQNITRNSTMYTDYNCTQRTKVYNAEGLFRYVTSYKSDIYEIEYKFNMQNGHYYTGDNVRRVGAKLYISDRRVGNGVIPDIPLILVQ